MEMYLLISRKFHVDLRTHCYSDLPVLMRTVGELNKKEQEAYEAQAKSFRKYAEFDSKNSEFRLPE